MCALGAFALDKLARASLSPTLFQSKRIGVEELIATLAGIRSGLQQLL